jgi:hypothetical protein
MSKDFGAGKAKARRQNAPKGAERGQPPETGNRRPSRIAISFARAIRPKAQPSVQYDDESETLLTLAARPGRFSPRSQTLSWRGRAAGFAARLWSDGSELESLPPGQAKGRRKGAPGKSRPPSSPKPRKSADPRGFSMTMPKGPPTRVSPCERPSWDNGPDAIRPIRPRPRGWGPGLEICAGVPRDMLKSPGRPGRQLWRRSEAPLRSRGSHGKSRGQA